MKVSVRSYLIAGVAVASTGIIAVTPAVLPVTPSWIAGAQPADDGSTNDTDRPGTRAGSGSPSADQGQNGMGTPARAAEPSQVGRSRASAVDSTGVAAGLPSRINVAGNSSSLRTTSDVQTVGASGNRVTVAANGSIRLNTQSTGSVRRVSASASSAADSAPSPSPGGTINVAVQRALAGQASATAHANGSAAATVNTEQAPTGIRAAQPARSSSPYAGNR
jgi:hypothetical protein